VVRDFISYIFTLLKVPCGLSGCTRALSVGKRPNLRTPVMLGGDATQIFNSGVWEEQDPTAQREIYLQNIIFINFKSVKVVYRCFVMISAFGMCFRGLYVG